VSGGVILAAPKSGSGKTLITAALLRHLRDRGIRVAAAKCGPDYIDPTFHARASGTPCVNLDPWAMRPSTLTGLVCELESRAEIVVCEGVMGLFDGAGLHGESGSTADLARKTGWPVVLVVDASGQGASVAALVAGFARHDPEVRVSGVILNRVAGERHRRLLADALATHLPGLALLGAISVVADFALPARHLGLVPADEMTGTEAIIARAAIQIGAAIDIGRLLAAACRSRCANLASAIGMPPLGQHIAIAHDEAFLFTYVAMLAGWRKLGAGISFFSPLADQPPSSGADAIFLPGGYPELYAGRLAAASRFLAGLRSASEAGQTIYGECGGYMVLGEQLIDAAGTAHRMAGLLPLATSFAERRRHLGYRTARLLASGPLGDEGTRFRGHEFHYATIVAEGEADPLFAIADTVGADLGRAGLRRRDVFGSFVHLVDRAN
jgi:cobyrinic acid a,c-diamide synthase